MVAVCAITRCYSCHKKLLFSMTDDILRGFSGAAGPQHSEEALNWRSLWFPVHGENVPRTT